MAAIAGGVSGCVGKTVTAPLSRLTILLQVGPIAGSSVAAGDGIVTAFSRIAQKEGFLSFWNGNMTNVLHRFPYSAMNFTVYEKMRAVLGKAAGEETPAVRFISGALGGGCATAMCYPLDLMRARLSVQSGNKYNGLVAGIGTVFRDEGFFGFYKGLNCSLLVAVPNMALGYCVYGTTKAFLLDPTMEGRYTDEKSGKLTAVGAVTSGAFSGLISSSITFPLDLARRRLQVAGAFPGSANEFTISGTFRSIIEQRGVRGLYTGLTSELFKVIPMCAVTFSAYELCLRLLGT
jgi:solute carrier family 25 (mitochondrial phosphate transporter), member 23/24/25/41